MLKHRLTKYNVHASFNLSSQGLHKGGTLQTEMGITQIIEGTCYEYYFSYMRTINLGNLVQEILPKDLSRPLPFQY